MTNEDEEKEKLKQIKGIGEQRESRPKLTYIQNLVLNMNYLRMGQVEIAQKIGRHKSYVFQVLQACERKGYPYYRQHKFLKPLREFVIKDINLPPRENIIIDTRRIEEDD